TFTLGKGLTHQIRQLAKTADVSLFKTLMAAYQVLLYRYSGQDDIVVGTPTLGRGRPEFNQIVGFFANPVVIRSDLSANPTFNRFLENLNQTVNDAIAHQDYPFSLLAQQLSSERQSSHAALFQASFGLLQTKRFGIVPIFGNGELGALTKSKDYWGELELTPYPLAQQEGAFELALYIIEAEGELWACFKYNTELFNADSISPMSDNFHTLLSSIVANPNQNVANLPLLNPAQRHRLLHQWQQRAVTTVPNTTVKQLFESQVEKNPHATAIFVGEHSVSYQQLNRQANQLAHYLMTQGAGPNVLVAVCMTRSEQLIVALLAIFKTGAAYLPLAPDPPQHRLNSMCQDARVTLILTQQKLLNKIVKATSPNTGVLSVDDS
ncbi:MAG: condensation domain-containing protein, partial [Psychrosphaera sp.]|nr:condensation domain-containing protein [Psychrosphaera sp.]